MENSDSKVLAWHLTRQGAEQMREVVSAAPMTRLVGLESSPEGFERKAFQLQPDILLVEYVSDQAGLAEVLERLRRSTPRAAVVALSASRDAQDILRAMRLGVREYLIEPLTVQAWSEAVQRLRRQVQASHRPSGRLLGVMGVKGGVGTSHLAINLAWVLSQNHGRHVALADLNLAGGELAFLLDLTPSRDMIDVARHFERIDALFFDGLMTEVAPGLRLLAAPSDLVAAEEINPEHVSAALDHLLGAHDVVIVDLPNLLTETSLLAWDRCELVFLVLEPTLVGLKAAQRLLSLSERLGHDAHKLAPVVNRADAKGSVPAGELKRVLNRKIVAWLPNDSKAIMASGNVGRPVLRESPRSGWSKGVVSLTERLVKAWEDGK